MELELAVRHAEFDTLEKSSVAQPLLADAGFEGVRIATHAIDHASPLDVDERAMIAHYLSDLRVLTRGKLDAEVRAQLDAFVDGVGAEPPALDRSHFVGVHLDDDGNRHEAAG